MAATTDQQISLTVPPRGSSSHLSRPARQLVPAFLQKLYEMVNDPADQDLIRWSDMGDSFFVLDQERFANEVLGRWFRHKRFSSFVRQLNMYGFHKITHLLRSNSDTEFWNFKHPHFLRGQPDLLCLIQRKKPTPTRGDEVHAVPAVVNDVTGNVAVGESSANQLLDINSIVNGVQAVKRHQAAISADLNELKNSNQHLGQEAMAARERQDTISRILKFLVGVFGHGDNQIRTDQDAPHAAVTRQSQRLMIANGRSGQKEDVDGVVEEESGSSMDSARSTNSTDVRLQKSYKSTTEIDSDVDELQSNIQSLTKSLGIDPTTLESIVPPAEGGGATSAPSSTGDVDMYPHVNIGPGQDFDFDSFLMNMPRANEEDGDLDKLAETLDASTTVVPKVPDPSKIGNASSEQLHAFLDGVASQDGSEGVRGGGARVHRGSQGFKVPAGAASNWFWDVAGVDASMGAGAGPRGRKRKSDVLLDSSLLAPTALADSTASWTTGNKTKRKR